MRGTRVTAAAALLAAAVFTGCGTDDHDNEPRPPVPTAVRISIEEDEIRAEPAAGSAVGEPGVRQPYVNQNANAPRSQADREAPKVVNLAIANLTDRPSVLRMEGPVERVVRLTRSGTGSFNIAMPSGVYRFSSPASTDTTRLTVGPSRVSSDGVLLLP